VNELLPFAISPGPPCWVEKPSLHSFRPVGFHPGHRFRAGASLKGAAGQGLVGPTPAQPFLPVSGARGSAGPGGPGHGQFAGWVF